MDSSVFKLVANVDHVFKTKRLTNSLKLFQTLDRRPDSPHTRPMSQVLEIRRALPADAPLLSLWDTRPHVIAATTDDPAVPEDWDWPTELAPRTDGTEFHIAMLADRPIGMLCIIDPATERTQYWGAVAPNQRAIDIWIGEEDCLNRGFGTQIMRWAIDRCFTSPQITAILIDPLASNTAAHRFYERLGFTYLYRHQFDATSDCCIYRLTRNTYEGVK